MVFKKLFKILKRVFLHKKRKKRKATKKRPRLARFKRKSKLHSKPRLRMKSKSKLKPKVIGVVTHYFPKVNAAVVKLKRPLKVGEPIWIKGKLTDFKQTVGSMQIDRKPIETARAGQEIGLQVFRDVRPGDFVFASEI